jgi:hypothetical protein
MFLATEPVLLDFDFSRCNPDNIYQRWVDKIICKINSNETPFQIIAIFLIFLLFLGLAYLIKTLIAKASK